MSTIEAGHPPVLPHTETGPLSPAEQRNVLKQLSRLLDSSLFKNSRRYPALLRFIVEETLEGRGEFLKERLLGVRVFDRPADYDTASDPIVRVTIAEIRKRIAQYYHDEEHDAEIRIELLPGRYAPEFRSRRDPHPAAPVPTFDSLDAPLPEPDPPPTPVLVQPAADPAPGPVPAAQLAAKPAFPPALAFLARRWYLPAAAFALLLAALLVYRFSRPEALDQFWAPVLASQNALLFCLPTDAGKTMAIPSTSQTHGLEVINSTNPGGSTFLDHESLGENVVYSDMLATLRVVNILNAHHHEYNVRLTTSTTLDDLRHGPAVLIGGLDNQWTVRALNPLRFHFAGSDDTGWYIFDEKNPSSRQWALNLKQPYTTVTRDYAIVARLHNEQTGKPQMIVAGIGMSGTAAGGEFVADEKSLQDLRQQLGPDFKDHDFEVVLSTDVVNGIAGFPKILAAVPVR